MSLRINSWKKVATYTLWIILAALFLTFFLRVAIWEKAYYEEKEGSERAVAAVVPDEREVLDETKPTEEEVAEYKVPLGTPRYINIPFLNIHAKVVTVGLKKSGELETPNNIFDAGWYTDSGLPGQNKNIVIDGHSGGPTEYNGVFRHIGELMPGETIEIVIAAEPEDIVYHYHVVDNKTIKLDEATDFMRKNIFSNSAQTGALYLISCTGEWSNVQNTYLSRQFVKAERI